MNCRHCACALQDPQHLFVDLGAAPPSNAFLRAQDLQRGEMHLPLKVFACPHCRLVQLDEVQRHEAIFNDDYLYFSSYSSSWLAHAKRYVHTAVANLGLHAGSLVMEVASNDGYLLQYVKEHGVPCVGVEPTQSTAEVARSKGIETVGAFFGRDFARRFAQERGRVDLLVANNVLAHVPDINDFAAGMSEVLHLHGAASLEFPHLLQLVRHGQFDTIYHEHYSYLSLHAVSRIVAAQGLVVWDVEELLTHGGSLRVWLQHASHTRAVSERVAAVLAAEQDAGMQGASFYQGFQTRCDGIKDALLDFLLSQKRDGRRVVAYGAAAKGNTLLNYAGIRPDLLPYVVDASPHKQGRWLPGSRIPVVDEARIWKEQPHFILILPWNLREEIAEQLQAAREWGGRFVTAVPRLRIW